VAAGNGLLATVKEISTSVASLLDSSKVRLAAAQLPVVESALAALPVDSFIKAAPQAL